MRIPRFWRRRQRDEELTRELEAYVAQEIAERTAQGLSPHAAREAALRKLGNVTRVRETVYEMHSLGWIESVARDVRYAARLLLRSRGFALAAIVSLTLGIGANTAIFELLNAVRLRSLPVSRPHELVEVVLDGGNRGMGVSPSSYVNLTHPLWELLRERQRALEGLFAWGNTWDFRVRGDATGRAKGLWVSGTLFPTLGIQPYLGRLLGPADDRRGCGARAVVISHAYWTRAFGGRPSAVGARIGLDGQTFEVAGVTPPGFFGLEVGKHFDVALPVCAAALWDKDALDQRNAWWLIGMGRLRPGWTLEQASQHVGRLSPGLFAETLPSGYDPETTKRWRNLTLKAVPAGQGVSDWRQRYATSLWLLLGITGLVLLIACANLANLMLARSRGREREFALRVAIGASRARLVSQALTESALLAVTGAALGGGLAGLLSGAIVSFLNTDGNPLHLELGTDWRVLTFTAGVAVLTCVACGLMPALRSSRAEPTSALKAGGRTTTDGPDAFSFQKLLVVTQVAVSLVLVVGALLFARSFRNLMTLDVGFKQDGLYVAIAGFNQEGQSEAAVDSQAVRTRLLDRVRQVPQVVSAATSTIIPLGGMSWTHGVIAPSADGERRGSSKFTWVSPGYFETMELQLLSGRDFSDRDTASSPRVIVVNETFVRQLLGGSSALGAAVRTLAEPMYPATEYQVVGIVRDTKYGGLRDAIPAMAFAPASQHPAPQPWTTLLVRSPASFAVLAPEMTRAYRDAGVPSDMVMWSLRVQVLDGLLRERLVSWLSAFFGVLAGLLAAIGLYGVMAYGVARRANEIAIRQALGAERRDVIRLMLGQAYRMVALGLAAGAAIALATGRFARSLLFGLEPHDVPTLLAAALILAAIGLVAAYVPARRASRVSPLEGLRAE